MFFPFILNILNRLYQLLISIYPIWTPQLESLMSAAHYSFCFPLNKLTQTYLQVDTPRSMNVLKRTGWLCMTSPNTSKMSTRSKEEPGQHKWTENSQGRLHQHRSRLELTAARCLQRLCVYSAYRFNYKTMRISCHKCTCIWRWKPLKDHDYYFPLHWGKGSKDNKHAPSHNHQSHHRCF